MDTAAECAREGSMRARALPVHLLIYPSMGWRVSGMGDHARRRTPGSAEYTLRDAPVRRRELACARAFPLPPHSPTLSSPPPQPLKRDIARTFRWSVGLSVGQSVSQSVGDRRRVHTSSILCIVIIFFRRRRRKFITSSPPTRIKKKYF